MQGYIRLVFRFILWSSVVVPVFFMGCVPDDEISDNPSFTLSFSNDTLIFDTVFTTIGSTTRYLKVYNRNDKSVNVSRIRLAGGTGSQFQINVDGEPFSEVKDVEIKNGDSLFILVRVTVDPGSPNTPFIVTDSILFETNGNLQDVDLAAWGQNAHFYVGNRTLEGLSYPYTLLAEEGQTVTWEDDKPYVIYGWGVVDSAAQLIIGPGVDIHFHQNSGLWVYKGGNIQVNGEKDSLVTFQGDRLESFFQDLPGQWDRIWINEGSQDNVFNYAVIKNGFIGLQAETLDESLGNTLILNNTVIQNTSRWGLFTIAYNVTSTNSLFVNCAENTVFATTGGVYDFRHCTFANYWNRSVRLDPSFTLSNNLVIPDGTGGTITLLGDLQAYFGNCIIYGDLEEELLFSEDEAVAFDVTFDHCVLKTEFDLSDVNRYLDCLQNQDPKFVDYSMYDFHLDTLSPASDAASLEVINTSLYDVTLDLDQQSRIADDGPDVGAYEFIPQGGGGK